MAISKQLARLNGHERKTFGERALLSTDPYVRWVSVEAGFTSPFSSQISRLLKAALGCPGGPPTDIMPLACYKQPKRGTADLGGGPRASQLSRAGPVWRP